MKRQPVDDRLVAVALSDLMEFNGGFRHGSNETPGKGATEADERYDRNEREGCLF
jgi:hypothetical protein